MAEDFRGWAPLGEQRKWVREELRHPGSGWSCLLELPGAIHESCSRTWSISSHPSGNGVIGEWVLSQLFLSVPHTDSEELPTSAPACLGFDSKGGGTLHQIQEGEN